jgi:hypothetical protein
MNTDSEGRTQVLPRFALDAFSVKGFLSAILIMALSPPAG